LFEAFDANRETTYLLERLVQRSTINKKSQQLEVRFATMFTGDLLGAVILLYALTALTALILFIERNQTPRR